ncbi:MAG: hypothetical protein IPI61_09130 [Syntrophaceae bacterium]|nr:hypothetical protein [Syntrophaceae bacterium]
MPKSGSLAGAHFVHGNYSPEIKFSVGERHDFMAPVEFTSVRGGLADSIAFEWKTIPTAIGYFAMAVGHSEKTGETILWSSSDAQEPGYGLMGYLPPADVNRFIRDRVVMGPAVTSCRIPGESSRTPAAPRCSSSATATSSTSPGRRNRRTRRSRTSTSGR